MQNDQTAHGYCQCGCGKRTTVSKRNHRQRGWVKGHHLNYVQGHSERKKIRPKQPNQKWCRKCNGFKPLSDFQISRTKPDGYQSLCRTHNKAVQYTWRAKNKNRFKRIRLKNKLKSVNATVEDYENVLATQNEKCAVCKQPESALYRGTPRSLSVDHCHKTNKLRGLLCTRCNTALGLLKEDLVSINNLAAYVKQRCS